MVSDSVILMINYGGNKIKIGACVNVINEVNGRQVKNGMWNFNKRSNYYGSRESGSLTNATNEEVG